MASRTYADVLASYRTRYAARKAAGLCVKCELPADPGSVLCESHRRRERERARVRLGCQPRVEGGRGRPVAEDSAVLRLEREAYWLDAMGSL